MKLFGDDSNTTSLQSLWDKPLSVLIVKLGAAGDVLRTTPLLRKLDACQVDWLTAPENLKLVPDEQVHPIGGIDHLVRGVAYDIVLSLEDDLEVLNQVFSKISAKRVLGAYVSPTASPPTRLSSLPGSTWA